MARAPDKRIEQAKAMYLSGQKLVEIAGQLNVPEGTIRSWKNRYKWNCNVTDNKCNVQNKKTDNKKPQTEVIADEVNQIIGNSNLTDKQRLFCLCYVKCFNATRAYRKAYVCDYATAVVNGPRLLGNARIKEEIIRLKQERLNREFLTEADIFQKYMDIAFADITDYVSFGKRKYIDPETGETMWHSYVELLSSEEVDGGLISEVSKGKEGAKIKLNDRMKALQWLTDHMDLATEEQKARVAQIKAQTDKLTGNNQEVEDLEEIEREIYGG